MNISLTPALEKFINDKVASGLYNSASEVIREALRLMLGQNEISKQCIEALNKDVQIGLDAYSNGDFSDGDEVMRKFREEFHQ